MLPLEKRPAGEMPQNAVEQCGIAMAEFFRAKASLLLDVDGVICESDSLNDHTVTSENLIPELRMIEQAGIPMGVATARGASILEWLRQKQGMKMDGNSILEEGQILVSEHQLEYLSSDKIPSFIADLRLHIYSHPQQVDSWDVVQSRYYREDQIFFCPGNFQWQGERRTSFWFVKNWEDHSQAQTIGKIFDERVRAALEKNNLEYKDISISKSSMSKGNLAIVSFKGRIQGLPPHKGHAAEKIHTPWVFVADGFGDTPIAKLTKKRNGLVVAIEGNLDDGDDSIEFLKEADFRLHTPEDFAQALVVARNYL